MRLRVLVAFLLMATLLQAATTANPLLGRWHFVPDKSKGGQHFPPDTTLVVKQAGSRMYFEYWANNHLFQRDEYRTDGKVEKLYTNANETATADSRLLKNQLRITTHHIMENEIGSKSFDDTDSWIASKDGSTLTFRSSDGQNMLFEREGAKPAAAQAPPAKK